MLSQTHAPSLAILSACRTNLLFPGAPLIGRARELQAACTYLRGDVRLLTLHGPAGVGKTCLALQVAAELLGLFVEGVYLVELAAIRDPDLVLSTIGQVLGVAEERGQPLLGTLGEHLRQKRVLLLLDNFEQVIGAAPFMADLLAAAPSLTLMVTSREVLRIYGEQEFQVPPLELPDSGQLPPLSLLDRNAAVALFVARAQQVKPDFQLTHQNARAVAEICQRLDGLPLAIELAAARCKILAPAALLARLDDRLSLLAGVARERAPRQQTLRDAIAWSYDLLDTSEQALFARLAVFLGGCTLDAVETVASGMSIEHTDLGTHSMPGQCSIVDSSSSVIEGLTSLIDKSLLRRIEPGDGTSRFILLETIREYALEQLTVRGEVELACERHAAYFARMAAQAEPELTSAEQAMWLERLERDHDNLRSAINWAIGHECVGVAARMVGALWRFWYTKGHLSEGRRWLEQMLELSRSEQGFGSVTTTHSSSPGQIEPRVTPPEVLAKLLTGAGVMAWAQGAFEQAYDHFTNALSQFQRLNDQPGIAQTLNNQGMVRLHQGDNAQAALLCMQSLTLFRTLKHTWGIANALGNLGMVAQLQGNAARAREIYAESLALRRELGDKRGIAMMLNNLGEVTLQQGDAAQARAFYHDSMTLCRELGDKDGLAYCLEGLADVAAARGQALRAARLWGAAEMLRETFGVPIAPFDRTRRMASVTSASASCDSETWTSSWRAGRAMTLEQAFQEAFAQD